MLGRAAAVLATVCRAALLAVVGPRVALPDGACRLSETRSGRFHLAPTGIPTYPASRTLRAQAQECCCECSGAPAEAVVAHRVMRTHEGPAEETRPDHAQAPL
jgi:hypothetical protein